MKAAIPSLLQTCQKLHHTCEPYMDRKVKWLDMMLQEDNHIKPKRKLKVKNNLTDQFEKRFHISDGQVATVRQE